MSDDTTVVAPETDPAVPDMSLGAPGDGTAVDTEGAELRKRFNGLMAKHQEALDALVREREARTDAEARLQEGQNTVSDQDNATLTEVQALRQELAESRLVAAKAEALRQFPDAAPFADLIAGRNPTEVMQVTRAFAERAASLKGAAPEVAEPVVETTVPIPTPQPHVSPLIPGSISAPVTAGGFAPPAGLADASQAAQDFRNTQPRERGNDQSWDAFWVSRSVPDEAAGLA